MPPRVQMRSRSRSRSRIRQTLPDVKRDPTPTPDPTAPPAPPLSPRFFHLILVLLFLPPTLLPEFRDPLTFFNVLNLLICYWELLLLPCLPRIQGSYDVLKVSDKIFSTLVKFNALQH